MKAFFEASALGILLTASVLFLSGCMESEADKQLKLGEQVVKNTCKVCHAQGINGAPIIGNKKMWKERAKQDLAVLVEHASNGYGLMPAKGGNEDLTTAEIEAAITYMLSKLEK